MSRAIVAGINSQYDMHLIYMVAMDIFSCFAHCQPIKSKTGEDVLEALKLILSGTGKSNAIRTDRGQEFRSQDVNAILKSQNICHYYALNTEIKVNYAERLIETLKHKLFRHMLKIELNATSMSCKIITELKL